MISATKDAKPRNRGRQRSRSTSVDRSVDVEFICSAAFQQMDDQQAWRAILRDAARDLETCPPGGMAASRVSPRRLPPHLESICANPLLEPEQERSLFRQMNFLKYRASRLLEEHGPNAMRHVRRHVDRLLEVSRQLRNKIVEANTRLVISIIKKFCDENNHFDELFSEGINCLMKAVDKFDVDRGFRFSTYVTCSVQREMVRLVKRSQNDRRRLTTVNVDYLEQQSDGTESARSDHSLMQLERTLGELVGRLDDREQFIIKMRHGLCSLGRKPTLDNLGRELGISKERVRQLEIRALEKLRDAAADCRLEQFLEVG